MKYLQIDQADKGKLAQMEAFLPCKQGNFPANRSKICIWRNISLDSPQKNPFRSQLDWSK
jgi:hypothetical protein